MRIALAILIGVSITGEADSSSHGIDVSAHIHNGLARRGDRVALVVAEQEPESDLGLSGSSVQS